MADTRARVPLNGKTVDLAALDAELGGHGLTGSDTEVVAVEGSPVTAQQLAAAVEAHEPPEPPLSIAEQFAAYKTNVQAAMEMRDEVDAARDDWLLDLEFRLIDLEG